MPSSSTAAAQAALDRALSAHLASSSSLGPNSLTLDREAHVAFARKALRPLPSCYSSLGASRPWLLHWATHSLSLLNAPLSEDPAEAEELRDSIVCFLRACECPETGGFGGGPGQEPHLATTYASTATLVTLGGAKALRACDCGKLSSFLLSCIVQRKGESKGYGFRVCPGGEPDVRGCYCALAASALLCLPAPADPRSLGEAAGLERYLRDCQTAEGGLGGFPGGPEAHGGYAFCGAAAAALASGRGRSGGSGGDGDDDGGDCDDARTLSSSPPPLFPLDPRLLLLWASRCQSRTNGGFAGRTNKLVDGCYSWWQGALFGMMNGKEAVSCSSSLSPPFSSPSSCPLLSSKGSFFPPFDASRLPALPVLPPLPAGMGKAPTETERIAREAERGGGDGGGGSDSPCLEAALEEARAASAVRQLLLPSSSSSSENSETLLYDPLGLQMWILAYCQEPSTPLPSSSDEEGEGEGEANDSRRQRQQQRKKKKPRRFRGGGLRDKPGKPPDHYHTCYCLSGLSAAQRKAGRDGKGIVGGEGNRLERTHFLLNVVVEKVRKAAAFFAREEEGEQM